MNKLYLAGEILDNSFQWVSTLDKMFTAQGAVYVQALSPRIRRASCISLGMIVTRLA